MKISNLPQNKIIITADDFAISTGVDETIINLCEQKMLTCVSSFTTTERVKTSIENLKKTGVNIGLHLSLTFGKALTIAGKSLITDGDGNFNRSFIQILLLCVLQKKNMEYLLEQEVTAQVLELKKYVNNLSHIDGHQHIHTIPLIFQLVLKLQKQHSIPRVRVINEHLFQKEMLRPSSIIGVVKLVILRLLYYVNGVKYSVYFMSIFRTCKMDINFITNYNIPKCYTEVEIMLHPGNANVDATNNSKECKHLKSIWRAVECNTAKKMYEKLHNTTQNVQEV